MNDSTLDQLEALIRCDPARRGLIGSEPQFGPLCPGHLAGAAAHLAEFGRSVVIATGFFIPRGDPPAAETDGPPGAVLLARALQLAGINSIVVTDSRCLGAVRAAADATGFAVERIVEWIAPGNSDEIDTSLLPRDTSHLIAIERVGPSHTLESFLRQPRSCAAPLDTFESKNPLQHRNHCHNMRGEAIDEYSAQMHRLFEEATRWCPDARTIGIGDGANEIGMGAVPWEELERRLSGEQSGRVPCRIACDWNIVAGTSNWGGYALAAAVLHLRGQAEFLEPFTSDQQRRVLEAMIEHGPAVDGVTRRREATVDGLPFMTYIQPWEGMRRVLRLSAS